MTATRYLIMTPTCDFMFTGILSAYILGRKMTKVRFSVAFICFVAYFFYDFIEYNGDLPFNFELLVKTEITGPLFCVFSRFFYCLQGVYSSKALL